MSIYRRYKGEYKLESEKYFVSSQSESVNFINVFFPCCVTDSAFVLL